MQCSFMFFAFYVAIPSGSTEENEPKTVSSSVNSVLQVRGSLFS